MKITIYELLGMVKDGKAPKKIRIRDYIYEYQGDDYMCDLNDKEYWLFSDGYTKFNEWLENFLNMEVEILEEEPRDIEVCGTWITKSEYDKLAHSEEEKKIPEKIEYYDDSIAWVIDDVGQLSDVDKVIIDKLNNVIDYLKSKGE